MSCPRPDKDVFHSWRDARRAVRRIKAQEGRWLEPYTCEGGHLHLTKVDKPTPITDQRDRKMLAHRYLNRTGIRRVA